MGHMYGIHGKVWVFVILKWTGLAWQHCVHDGLMGETQVT